MPTPRDEAGEINHHSAGRVYSPILTTLMELITRPYGARTSFRRAAQRPGEGFAAVGRVLQPQRRLDQFQLDDRQLALIVADHVDPAHSGGTAGAAASAA